MKVLKFNAIWCSACLVMKKIFKHVENMHPELEFITYDYDNDEDMVEKYNIGTTIPVLVFVDENENEVGRIIGEKSYEEIEEYISEISGENE